MSNVNRSLQMVFRNAEGRNTSLSISDPKTDLEAEQVEAVMNSIVAANIFQTTGGEIESGLYAQIITREVESIVEELS